MKGAVNAVVNRPLPHQVLVPTRLTIQFVPSDTINAPSFWEIVPTVAAAGLLTVMSRAEADVLNTKNIKPASAAGSVMIRVAPVSV